MLHHEFRAWRLARCPLLVLLSILWPHAGMAQEGSWRGGDAAGAGIVLPTLGREGGRESRLDAGQTGGSGPALTRSPSTSAGTGTGEALLRAHDPSSQGPSLPAGRKVADGGEAVAGSADWVQQARRASRRSLPVWELGVAASGISLPDYRGAESGRSYLLPFPVFVYRAPHLRVDRSGIRADLWDDDRFELDVSVGLSAPVRSDPDGIRAGMPRLRPLFEIGPRLLVHLWSGDAGRRRLQLQLPLRHAMPLGKLESTGWLFSPNLTMHVDDVAGLRGWQLSAWAGPMFGSRGYHQYHYRVDPAHARADRPAYSARGGYGGMQMALALNRRYPEFWVAGFVRADHVGGAVFETSPLVRRRGTVTAGLVVGWLFMRSAGQVAQTD